jgi:hypothetical protein
MAHVPNMLPHLRDHHLEAYFINGLLETQRYSPLSNAETQVAQYLKHFEQVDDTDLKCMLSD